MSELALPGTELQPHARVVLGSALSSGQISHAYLFQGPGGSGKRSVAAAFAAELLAMGLDDAAGIRQRAMRRSHPDLTWVSPRGVHAILVDDIRQQVVGAASLRPFESKRRVFVIEQAELMNDEASNALLMTLEEPPGYAHLILTSSAPERLLATVRSRCQAVRFRPIPLDEIERELIASGADAPVAQASARLSRGDGELARFLATRDGGDLRRSAVRAAAALVEGDDLGARPWLGLIEVARESGEKAKMEAESAFASELELVAAGRQRQARKRELEQAAKRASRRARTRALRLALFLMEAWLRDLVALSVSGEQAVANRDMVSELSCLNGPGRGRLARMIGHCERMRSSLRLNVSEELALEALFYRA